MDYSWMEDIDQDWTLFLDRDGVINRRIAGDYIRKKEEFVFLDGVMKALSVLTIGFGHQVIVTNQQGIGKGLFTEEDLYYIHEFMFEALEKEDIFLTGLYFCPHLAKDKPRCRKPEPGMAEKAKTDFPAIDFSKSVMVGDSPSDIEFGSRLGMKTVFITNREDLSKDELEATLALCDLHCESLIDFAKIYLLES